MKLKLLAAAGALLLLCSCASHGNPVSNPPVATASAPAIAYTNYLATSQDAASQDGAWTIDIALSSGRLYEAEREGQKVLSVDGTAELHGNTLTLSARKPIGSTALLDGGTYATTTRDNEVDVEVPFQDGSIRTYPFFAATLDNYNGNVTQLDNAAQQAIQSAAQATAQQQQQPQPGQQQQNARDQAQANHLQMIASQNCSAVGGQLQGKVTVSSGSPWWGGVWCSPVANRTWQPIHGAPIFCVGLSVPFNNDGTLDQADLQSTEESYPGCYG